jgi:hypothetical protein
MNGLFGLSEPILFFGGIALIAAVVVLPAILLAKALRQDRRTALAKFADRHGLVFHTENHPWHEDWYAAFDLLARERPREQRNIMTGRWRGLDVAVLDYDYEPQQPNDEGAATAQRTVVIVYLPWSLPGVIIEPNATNRFMRRASAVHPRAYYMPDDTIEEVSSFERRYVLLAEDQAAAARLLHADMETLLLEWWGIGVEVAGTAAVFFAYRVLRPSEIKALLDFAARFCELIPDSMHIGPEQSLEQRTE